MRRQTSTGGVKAAGSSRALRLDPLSLPLSFAAHDSRADGSVRHIELHRERVVVRRALAGMRMAISVRVDDYLGLAFRRSDDAHVLTLVHRDPALSIPLSAETDGETATLMGERWSTALALPLLPDEKKRDPASRRRRRNVLAGRRPKFLLRRRIGAPLDALSCHVGERELIARD